MTIDNILDRQLEPFYLRNLMLQKNINKYFSGERFTIAKKIHIFSYL